MGIVGETARQESLGTLEERDGILRVLVDTVTGTDDRLPVTLAVGGMLVSGYVVSGHKYFEEAPGGTALEALG